VTGKITKKKFEAAILEIHENVSACRHEEESIEEGVFHKMWLYYSGNVHIGTWLDGEGWYYEETPQ
jgi:hypothetical protein